MRNTKLAETKGYYFRINEHQKQLVKEKIELFFIEKENYLNTHFGICDLAAEVNICKTYVSNVINEKYGFPFRDLLNYFRVQKAQELLTSGYTHHYRIDAIAQMVGFSSKVSFYSAFKKHLQITPHQYRQRFLKKVSSEKSKLKLSA